VRHFAAALHAFRSLDLDAARTHLEQVQSYAPHHVGARNGMAKIRQHAADIECAKMAWELAHSGKKLVAAKRAVDAWRKLVDPALPEVREAWKEVTSALRQAEELAARSQAGACRSTGCAQPLPQEPGHRGRLARRLDRSEPLPARRPDRPGDAGAGGPGPAFLDAPSAGRPGAAHLRCHA